MAYDPKNIFARIISGEVPCNKLYEDDHVLAFEDAAPAAPVHILVVPKTPYESFHDFSQQAEPSLVAHFFHVVSELAKKYNVVDSGYRLITNHGANASQTVPHFHMHLLGGRRLGGLLVDDIHHR